MARALGPMRLDDLDSVITLQREGAVSALSHIFPQDTHPFPVAKVRRRWTEELAGSDTQYFVIQTPDQAIRGFAATRGNEFLHFGTAVAMWGSGLAGQAHEEVLDHLREHGQPLASLWVFEKNGRARRFYEKRGWVMTGRRMESGFSPHPILLQYQRDLAQP
jgi:putative acetyltransferase